MVKKCCVKFCKSESYAGCGISFHSFPKDGEIKQKWLDVVPVGRKITKNSVVCSHHFKKEDFYEANSRQLVKADVIPSIFSSLPNDMENYIQYRVMGSVSQVRMKAGCIPTRFECQPDRRKRTSKTAEHSITNKKSDNLAGENTTHNEDLEPSSPLSESPDPESGKTGSAICRVCLASGAALRDIAAVGLKLAFEQLTKAKLNTKDGRPKTICHVCCAQLARFRAFRKLSQRAESIMKDITTKGLEITESTVSEQNLQLHTTPVLDVCATRYTTIHTHENPNECMPMEVKVESEDVDIKLEDNVLTGIADSEIDNVMETDILENKDELDSDSEETDASTDKDEVDVILENHTLSEVLDSEVVNETHEMDGIKIEVEEDEETVDTNIKQYSCVRSEVLSKSDSEIHAPCQTEEPPCKRTCKLDKDSSSLSEFCNESYQYQYERQFKLI